ncbi:IS200/IS605 family element transposase accessory protein TnpB [Phormidium sp. FACHB-592]|uniref:Transposase n=1 Tax=Stenomitos frigidus AS-A4 TaxID=2933935 RepID=A0ABV0KT39_9CYAN|nr:RNA-guided endonuclease TnpB family protein [Phormidium sp. FACHB-592]MBD2078257.1 IS200/IS605 family element transposase accessory protein TnpB [Phormidium sp. FACHB-592]
MFGCQPILIESNPVLEFVCSEANKLTNQGLYYARQWYFKTGKYVSKFDLNYQYKPSKHFAALAAQAAQQVLGSVYEAFKSYRELLKLWRAGELADKPKLPNYRTKGGLAVVSYPKQAIKLVDGQVRLPLGNQIKAWFDLDCFMVPMPSNLKFKDIKEVRLLPRNGCFYAEFVYRLPQFKVEVDFSKALGIDSGLHNWLTCISNIGTSFIVDGLQLKSVNRWYNKQISTVKEGQPQGFWSKRLAGITETRNRQMRDAINKAARLVLDHCLEHSIGTVVFGWNKGQRQAVNLGHQTNQKFVQIPTARLKDRIAQLCEQYGLQFVETEESYTSKASFVDGDQLPVFGAKPEGWQASGKRTKRGLYRTAMNWYINADCNGAANILRKVATMLGLDLSGVGRGSLTAPTRMQVWVTAKRRREAASLQSAA